MRTRWIAVSCVVVAACSSDSGCPEQCYATPHVVTLQGEAVAMSAGDFDGDGFVDLFVTEQGFGPMEIFYGDGAGGFSKAIIPTTYAGVGRDGFVAADLNGDGLTDVLACDSYPGVEIALGSTSRDDVFFNPDQSIQIGSPVLGADFFTDDAGRTDLVSVRGSFLFGYANGDTGLSTPPVQAMLPHGAMLAVPGRFGGPTNSDLVIATDEYDGADEVFSLQVFGNDQFTGAAALPETALEARPNQIATADVNGDGVDEVFVRSIHGVQVFARQVDNTFVAGDVVTPSVSTGMLAAHMTSGASGDLVLAKADAETVTTFVDRDGHFEPGPELDTGDIVVDHMLAADLDGDGISDLVVEGSGRMAVLLSSDRH